jgi:hypothetical protein
MGFAPFRQFQGGEALHRLVLDEGTQPLAFPLPYNQRRFSDVS